MTGNRAPGAPESILTASQPEQAPAATPTPALDVVRELLAVRDRIIAESVEGSGVVTCDTCGAESDQPSKAAGIAWLSRHKGRGCA